MKVEKGSDGRIGLFLCCGIDEATGHGVPPPPPIIAPVPPALPLPFVPPPVVAANAAAAAANATVTAVIANNSSVNGTRVVNATNNNTNNNNTVPPVLPEAALGINAQFVTPAPGTGTVANNAPPPPVAVPTTAVAPVAPLDPRWPVTVDYQVRPSSLCRLHQLEALNVTQSCVMYVQINS